MACTAYFILFTTWAFYDDEGYVLWTLIHHRQGHILYEEIFSQYGPAFYALDMSLRTLIPFAYTTDGQRWQTLAFWIISTFLLLRTWETLNPRSETRIPKNQIASTGSFLFATIAFFWHQEKLALEPGHPQIWCSLLVCMSLYLIAARYPSEIPISSSSVPLLQGIMAGVLFMIKPNVGVLLLAALPSGYLWSVKGNSPSHVVADFFYTVALIALPWCLMWQQLGSLDAWVLPGLISISVFGMRLTMNLLQTSGNSQDPATSVPSFESLSRISIGMVLAVGFFAVWSMTRGVSLEMLKRGMFGQHSSLLSYYFHPAIRSPLGWLAVCLFTLGSLSFLGVNVLRQFRGMDWRIPSRIHWGCLFCFLGPILVTMNVMEGIFPLVHGLQPRGASEAILAFSPAIVVGWLVLRLNPPKTETTDLSKTCRTSISNRMALSSIAAIAAFQPLIAYPVPGTQLSLGTLPLVLLLVDGCRTAREENHLKLFSSWLGPRGKSSLPPFSPAGLLATGCVMVCIPVLVTGHRYFSRNSLALPGADLLRLDSQETERILAWMKTIQESNVDSMAFRWHNRPSWYLWTEIQPPHCQLPPSWNYLIGDARQQQQLKEYERFDRVLVVDESYSPPVSVPRSPLQNAWTSAGIAHQEQQDITFSIWHPNGESTK